jgi:probable DNA repair protein
VVNAFANITDVLAEAASDHILITPNERLARELRRGFNQRQQQNGYQAWLTPQCLSLNQHLANQFTVWQDGCDEFRQLLPTSALLSRFYQCAAPTQRHLTASAAQAQELIYRYDIDLNRLQDSDGQSEMFVHWARQVLKLTAATELYPAQLAKFLCSAGSLSAKPLLLIAFDHLTATEQSYLTAANANAGVFYWTEQNKIIDFAEAFLSDTKRPAVTAKPTSNRPRLFGFDSLADELAAAAIWAADTCQQQPDARVAVVVPQLAKHYLRVQRQFSVIFDPQHGSATRCFDLSGGVPLNTQPAWEHASKFLHWCHTPTDSDTARTVAFSPFLSAPWCQSALRNWAQDQRHLALTALTHEPSAAPMLKHLNQMPLKASFAHWLEQMSGLLSKLDWPRISDLESTQFQAVTQIRETMNSLMRQHAEDEQQTDFKTALELFELHLQNKTFAPQRPASQVQVLGLLETTGLDYSHLWVCGMDANNFPQGAQNNPFIPVRIAKQHRLPRITPSQELQFSEQILAQWLHSSASISFSYVRVQDAYETLPSLPIAAIAELATLEELPAANLSKYHPYFQSNDVALERQQDWYGSGLADGYVHGGTGILQDQLECPFRAYARHRLGLRQEREPSEFPDALERGIVLHGVMQLLGDKCGDREQLLELTSRDINTACRHILSQRRPLPAAFIENECSRLTALIQQWIEIERLRFPFTIEAVEQDYQLDIDGLTFALRVDRIDRQGNSLTVFDYKTSSRTINGATKNPPTDVQLPIYSLLNPDISNVAYACIGDKDVKAVGIGEQPLDPANKRALKIHAAKNSWNEQRTLWQQNLSALAQAIQHGDARVTPQKNACRHCHLQGFCRINVTTIEESEDDSR